ncbi:MAG: CoA transferase [Flavobacteriales bacterium]|nr:CoA transferase [Flavobacteriales bacterium]
MKPFEHLKVVELASVLAGPSVGLFFAELGAKVIKIENQQAGGDVTRSWKLASEDQQHPFSAYYSSVNYGKESWFLNLNETADLNKVLEEIKTADLVIANFKPGDAAKLGLSFEQLKSLNPQIIYGEITGFGSENRIAYDVVLQAESGFLAMSGTPEGELCKMPVALIDLLAAHQLKEGILLAMLQQQKEKKALKVSVSLFDAALSSLANQATNWLMGNHIAQPMGTLHPNIAPYGELFTCKDEKQVVLAIGSNRQFKALCETLTLDTAFSDSRFNNNQNRVKNRIELAELLSAQISNWNREEIMNRFIENNVPAGAVRKMDEVFSIPAAQKQLLKEQKEGKDLIAVSGNAFKITP